MYIVAIGWRSATRNSPMKDLLEVIAASIVAIVIFGAIFILQGNPSLWDKWHDEAMGKCECAKGKN
jgi:hypothetical protein